MNRWSRVVLVLVVVVGVLGGLSLVTRPAPEYVRGELEVRRVSVSAKIPGRIESVLVREGDRVEAGSQLAELRSPEIEAKLRQAEGAVAAASAQSEKARAGVRSEELMAAEANVGRAEAAVSLAESTFRRVQALYDEGVIPGQKRDEAEAQLEMARGAVAAARATHRMALAGARAEDRAAAAGLLGQAEGARAEAEAYLAETVVSAPAGGVVVERLVEPGEIVSPGFPILILADLADAWVTFNLREDQLRELQVGTRFSALVPALGEEVEWEVTYLNPLGDFATWRSTRQRGGYDLRTFEVRARPLEKVSGLRPGMSVVTPWTRLRASEWR